MATTKLCTAGFTKSIDEKGDVTLEGWANKSVVDRGNDIIRKDAWKLDNFKKNGMILFNHDRMQPVGKAVAVEARDEGLFIKVKLSKSSHPDIMKVRDLVKEGVLNAFSVGFEARDEQKSSDGVNEIKSAELYECSIVSIPMNQDSLFEVSVKDIEGMTLEAARDKILRFKGALVAARVHSQLYDLVEAGGNRDELLKAVTDAAEIDLAALTEVLAGNVEKVPANVLTALSEVLGIDGEELAKLDAGEGEIEVEADEPDDKVPPAEDAAPTEMAEGDKPAMMCQALVMPKGDMSEDDAKAAAEAAGYSTDVTEHTDESYKFVQSALDNFEGELVEEDIGDGVIALMGCMPKKEKQANQETGPTVPLQGGGPGSVSENPYIEQTKQTNVLLGVLIAEMQKLSEAIGRLAAPAPVLTPPPAGTENNMVAEDAALAKSIRDVAESYLSLDARFKQLGI